MRNLGIILAFSIWSFACNWWYLCKIKNLCPDTPQSEISMVSADPDPEPEPENLKSEDKVLDDKIVPSAAPKEEENSLIPDPKVFEPFSQEIHFPLASSRMIRGSDLSKIQQEVKERIESDTKFRIIITGHTCDLGEEDYNLRLGLERAGALKLFLISMGVNQELISVDSQGEKMPLNSNVNESERRLNRRAELLIQP